MLSEHIGSISRSFNSNRSAENAASEDSIRQLVQEEVTRVREEVKQVREEFKETMRPTNEMLNEMKAVLNMLAQNAVRKDTEQK